MSKPMTSSESDLLRRQIESIGDAQARERLENRAAFDELRIEIETLRRAVQDLSPELANRIGELRQELIQRFDPEASETGQPAPPLRNAG
jgi:hypothetical protein